MHGRLFNDIKIYSPEDIHLLDFDLIIIASVFSSEIEAQLINELKIDKNKILVAPKRSLKQHHPFNDAEVRKNAVEIIKTLSESILKNKLPCFLDMGALLGFIRDGDLIKWDDDIDFSVLQSDLDKGIYPWVNEVIFSLPKQYQYRIHKDLKDNINIKVNIDVIQDKKVIFGISFRALSLKENKYLDISKNGFWYIDKEFCKVSTEVCIDNQLIPTPYNVNSYLTFLYGDWEKPNKDFSFSDYKFKNNN